MDKTLALALLLLASLFYAQTSHAVEYAVIVNTQNPISGDADDLRNEVKRVFLKQKKNWAGGTAAKPFDRGRSSEVRAAFLSGVLQYDDPKLAEHWLKMKQTTGQTPPQAVSSERVLIKMIEKNAGGIGVVPQAFVAELPASVRVLFTFDG